MILHSALVTDGFVKVGNQLLLSPANNNTNNKDKTKMWWSLQSQTKQQCPRWQRKSF